MSGSSKVSAHTDHLRVSAESVRMIFSDPEDERSFHDDWRRTTQPLVDEAARRLAPVLETFAKKKKKKKKKRWGRATWTLAPWDPSLPEAWSWARPDERLSPEQVCAQGPCRCAFQIPPVGPNREPLLLSFASVEVAVAEPPPRESIEHLVQAFTAALIEEPPKPP
jgi:hypothetical protein